MTRNDSDSTAPAETVLVGVEAGAARTSRAALLRSASKALVVSFLTLLISLGAVSEAAAYPYAANGPFGAYTIGDIVCKKRIWGTTATLVSEAPAPRAWARDVRAGANNDSIYVRYMVYLRDASTGSVTASSGWSGWGYATDATPATWTGPTTLSHAASGRAQVIDYRLEFWNSTSMTAWVVDRSTRYQYYDQYNRGPFLASSC